MEEGRVLFSCSDWCVLRLSGMVEMIPQADTLRKIQVEHGVTGSFKDRTLADWLQKHNPTEEQYDKVTHLCRERHTCDVSSTV